MKKYAGQFILLALLSATPRLFATHNRAGEIVYSHLGENTYEIQIITYTAVKHNNADRPVLGINYGDSSPLDSIKRHLTVTPFNGNSEIQENVYITIHTFPGPGYYKLSVEDPNRNGGVLNIPNSVEQQFYIYSTLRIYLGKSNSTPHLEYPPIAVACLGYPFIYNPGAVDPDLDSLSYSLKVCKGGGGKDINGYVYPDASKFFTIDPITGTVTWDSPTSVGEYNIAILITEFRRELTANGKISVYEVGSILRDMQISVVSGCSNRPPEFEQQQNYCIQASDTLTFTVVAADTIDGSAFGNGDKLQMEAVGAPFNVQSPATLSAFGIDPVTGLFNWNTNCLHVRKRPYTVNFRTTDNGIPPLSNYLITNIMVIAPAVKNITATPKSSSIELRWEKEICSQASGYKIYRRLGASGFIPDSCQTGVPDNIEYKLIFEGNDINQVEFIDNDKGEGLIPGEIYCYLIVAYFSDNAESYASAEVCTKLNKDIPILTNVDIRNTDYTNGSILVVWSKPNEHDTIAYPGPYKYRIWRTVARKTSEFAILDSLAGINDTIYLDTNLNTVENEYMYKIEMIDLSTGKNNSMGYSVAGTSILLRSVSKDNELILIWDEKVPWRNKKYSIYKKRFDESTFSLIQTLTGQQFHDKNLTNNSTYCYYIESSGEYTLPSIAKPLINKSQIHCAQPEDLQAPCAPIMYLQTNDCGELEEELLQNPAKCKGNNIQGRVDRVHLEWTNPNVACDTTDDVLYYKIYYSPVYNGTFSLWKDNIPVTTTSTDHQLYNTRAGCYYITAIDSFDNPSPLLDTVCSDNCLLYKLPNVFTPNGDGVNDYFHPFPYCFVESVQCKIFSRWGLPVFETTDPDILWNGMNIYEKKPVAEGVYFYTCTVNYYSVFGMRQEEVKGVVQVLGIGKIQEN